MNPRLIKFAVELQNCEKAVKTEKKVGFLNLDYKAFFKILTSKKAAVPVKNNIISQ